MRRSFGLAVAAIVAACSNVGSPEIERVLLERHLWRSHQLGDYDFTYTMMPAECAAHFRWDVIVRGGKATLITETKVPCFGSNGAVVTSQSDSSRTMEWLFERALAELNRGSRVTIDYDPEYGYPRTMFVDQNAVTADDEFEMKTTLTRIGK